MALETKPWDIQEYLTTTERQLGYLEAALEDGDPQLVATALGDIAKARGMATVAQDDNLAEENAPSAAADPTLSRFMNAVKALGLRLRVEAA